MFSQRHTLYKIIDERGFTFTKDHILIYNLFAYDLPETANVHTVSEHFQKFGKVLNVRLLGRAKSKRCVIYFEDPNDAAKVLQETRHIIMNHLIRIEACHSLHQPNGQSLLQDIESFKQRSSIESAKSSNSFETYVYGEILTLNDDCLEYICKKLNSGDQINFALTCQRFYLVFEILSKVQYSRLNVNIFQQWTLLQIKIFLKIVGPQVKTLEVSSFNEDDYYKNVSKFLGSFCINVEKLHVFNSINFIKLLSHNMQKLRELEMFAVIIKNNLIKYLNRFTNLKSLIISRISHITGKHIDNLGNLEKLTVHTCSQLVPSYFIRSSYNNLRNLYYLDIIYYLLKTEDYENIATHLLQLRTLKFSCSSGNYNCLAQLPNLNSLQIWGSLNYATLSDEFLKNLAKFRCNQLEKLKLIDLGTKTFDLPISKFTKLRVLYCDHSSFEDQTLALLLHLTKLEELSLFNCEFLNDETVLFMLKKCRKLKYISLYRSLLLQSGLLWEAEKLLQEQRCHLLRTHRVRLQINPDKCICTEWNNSDVLEVICLPLPNDSPYEDYNGDHDYGDDHDYADDQY